MYLSICSGDNVLTTAAGFLLASRGTIDLWLFTTTFIGTTLVIASACVLNNFLDQDIDTIMDRTKKRAIVSGEVKGSHAVIFSVVLGILGILILYRFTNLLVVVLGLVGFIVYVLFYGMLSKRLSIHGTLVGSVSGAIPILAGYVAVTNSIDIGAVLVFLALFFWQMPEFYSIAIYRLKEYKKANIPVMPVVKGVKNTTIQIFIYTILFVASTLLLTLYGYAGMTYFVVMALLGGYWLWLGAQGFDTEDPDKWARKMFRFSLIILLAYCLMISIDWLLP